MQRLEPKVRREQILTAALEMAVEKGYREVYSLELSQRIGCSNTLVLHYYKTMAQFRRAIMRAAIQRKVMVVIAQGIIAGDPHAKRIPEDLKKQALASLA